MILLTLLVTVKFFCAGHKNRPSYCKAQDFDISLQHWQPPKSGLEDSRLQIKFLQLFISQRSAFSEDTGRSFSFDKGSVEYWELTLNTWGTFLFTDLTDTLSHKLRCGFLHGRCFLHVSVWLKASSVSEFLSCVLSLAVVKGKILVLPTYRAHSCWTAKGWIWYSLTF